MSGFVVIANMAEETKNLLVRPVSAQIAPLVSPLHLAPLAHAVHSLLIDNHIIVLRDIIFIVTSRDRMIDDENPHPDLDAT